MVVKLLDFFGQFTSFFNEIGEIYSVMSGKMMKSNPVKIRKEFTLKIISFTEGAKLVGPGSQKKTICARRKICLS